MSQSQRDPRVREFLTATRVVWSEGIEHVERLLVDDESACVIQPGASVLLDFGRELHGAVRFDVPTTDPKGSPLVRVRFGESASEAMGETDQDHAIHDHTIRLAWMGRTEVGETGFRFVRLDNVDPEMAITLRVALAVFLYRDDPWLGGFECSDPRLNAIWDTGAYTVHLCMQDHVWDGIKRDRLVWIGDLHPEAMVIATVFGDHPIVPASLDFVRDRTPLPGWMNGIGSYSLWWLLIHADWYERFGDRDYLAAQTPYLKALLAQLAARVDENGAERLDGHRFLEWPTARDPAAIDAGLQALTVLALERGAGLLRALDDADPLADTYAALAAKARTIARPNASKQATALQALAGMIDAADANAATLAVDPFRGLSTFYGYYVLQARAAAGEIDGCLALIKNYWGGMLDAGATTFWEGFEIDWLENASRIDELPQPGKKDIHADYGDHCYFGLRHSLCHGWAAGPTAWLSEWVLGVRVATDDHGVRVTVRPNLGRLDWARGTVPTPRGVVTVQHRKLPDGTVQSRVDAPDGVTVG